MPEFTVRGLTLGSGRPKICVPISFKSSCEIPGEIERLGSAAVVDIAEWRADGFNLWYEPQAVMLTLKALRQSLNVPIIFTCRTSSDGGLISPSSEYYVNLLRAAVISGNADIVDVELNSGEEAVKEIIKASKDTGTGTILSFHNFSETPGDISSLLNRMLQYDADIYKVACMPKSKEDVIALMAAATGFLKENPKKLLISISMGSLGVITRVMAGFTGSPLTFGSAGRESAPGQIDSTRLSKLLELADL